MLFIQAFSTLMPIPILVTKFLGERGKGRHGRRDG